MANGVEIFRPKWVTWICVFFYVAGLANIIVSFTGLFAPYGLLYSGLNVLLIVILFAAISGVWSMEKWGVYLFSIIVLIKIVLDIFYGAFLYWQLILLIPVVLFFLHTKKMK